jgi:hypothetical protein
MREGLFLLLVVVLCVRPVLAGDSVISQNDTRAYLISGTLPRLMEVDLEKKTCQPINLGSSFKGQVMGVALSNAGFVLCATKTAVWAYDPAKVKCVKVCDAPKAHDLDGNNKSQDIVDISYDPRTKMIVVVTEHCLFCRLPDEDRWYSVGDPNALCDTAYLWAPAFSADGTLFCAAAGDLCAGFLNWEQPRDNSGDQPRPHKRVHFEGYRCLPFTLTPMGNFDKAWVGFQRIAVTQHAVYGYYAPMEGKGASAIFRAKRPASLTLSITKNKEGVEEAKMDIPTGDNPEHRAAFWRGVQSMLSSVEELRDPDRAPNSTIDKKYTALCASPDGRIVLYTDHDDLSEVYLVMDDKKPEAVKLTALTQIISARSSADSDDKSPDQLQPPTQVKGMAAESFLEASGELDGNKIKQYLKDSYQQCLARATQYQEERLEEAQQAWTIFERKTDEAMKAMGKTDEERWKVELQDCIARGSQLCEFFNKSRESLENLQDKDNDAEDEENRLESFCCSHLPNGTPESAGSRLVEAEGAWHDYKTANAKADAELNPEGKGLAASIQVINQRIDQLNKIYNLANYQGSAVLKASPSAPVPLSPKTPPKEAKETPSIVIGDGSIKVNGHELRNGLPTVTWDYDELNGGQQIRRKGRARWRYISLDAASHALKSPAESFPGPRGQLYAWPKYGIRLQEGYRFEENGKIFKFQIFFEDDFDNHTSKHTGSFGGHIMVNGVDIDGKTSLNAIREQLIKNGFMINDDDTPGCGAAAIRAGLWGSITIFFSSTTGNADFLDCWYIRD